MKRACLHIAACLAAAALLPAGAPRALPAEEASTEKPDPRGMAILEEAIALAQKLPNPADKAEAIGMAAEPLARYDPRRALKLVRSVDDCHEKSEAMGAAAISLARENELLGLSVLARVPDRSVSYMKFTWIMLARARQSVPQAIELAEKVENPAVRTVIQLEVARELAKWHPDGPRAAVDATIEWVKSIVFEAPKAEGYGYAAAAAAKFDLDWALKLARTPHGVDRDIALRLVAETVAETDMRRALQILEEIVSPRERSSALVSFARVLRQADPKRCEQLLQQAATEAARVDDARPQGELRRAIAELLAPLDFEDALEVAEQAWPLAQKAAALESLAYTVAPQDPERALILAKDLWDETSFLQDPLQRRLGFAHAVAAAGAADLDQALALVADIPEPEAQWAALRQLAVRLSEHQFNRAVQVARSIEDPEARNETLRLMAVLRAPHGVEAAYGLAHSIPDLAVRAQALAGIARALLTPAA